MQPSHDYLYVTKLFTTIRCLYDSGSSLRMSILRQLFLLFVSYRMYILVSSGSMILFEDVNGRLIDTVHLKHGRFLVCV